MTTLYSGQSGLKNTKWHHEHLMTCNWTCNKGLPCSLCDRLVPEFLLNVFNAAFQFVSLSATFNLSKTDQFQILKLKPKIQSTNESKN